MRAAAISIAIVPRHAVRGLMVETALAPATTEKAALSQPSHASCIEICTDRLDGWLVGRLAALNDAMQVAARHIIRLQLSNHRATTLNLLLNDLKHAVTRHVSCPECGPRWSDQRHHKK